MNQTIKLLSIITCFISSSCSGQENSTLVFRHGGTDTYNSKEDSLRIKLKGVLTQPYNAIIGVAIRGIESGDTFTLNNNHPFPMQSVYKFPLAMAVLHMVDSGKLSLDQKIHIDKKDLDMKTWSPMRDKYPEGNIDLTLGELIRYTVSESDNNACDLLFRLMNGPKKVNNYIYQIGIPDISIMSTEDQMHKKPNLQYRNTSTPEAMLSLLTNFYNNKHLSDSSHRFLMQLMTESNNSPNRIKGLLPAETNVAHKTGTSGANDKGLSAATNDVGIVTLPNGQHFAIAVFVSESMEKHEINEKIIANITKAVYDYFLSKDKK